MCCDTEPTLSESRHWKRSQVQQHASCGDMEKAQHTQPASVPMIVQYCVLETVIITSLHCASIMGSLFWSRWFRSVVGKEKRASASCFGRPKRDYVVRTLSLTTTCPTSSIGSFPFYSSLSLPHDLSPRTLMNQYRVPGYCCPQMRHTFAEIQIIPLSITSPATLPRVPTKSYGSSKIPTTRQTFSSEPCLTVVCVQNLIQRGSLKSVPFPFSLELTRLSMYFINLPCAI